MSVDRIKCINPDCTNTIQPATATRNDGYCGPCHGKILNARHNEHIRQNRRDVDVFAGISDPVEIIRLTQRRREPDPLIRYLPPPRTLEDLYTSLTEAQAQRLVELAAQALRDDDKHLAEDIARPLASFTSHNLDAMLQAFIDLDRFWPPIAFRSAGPCIRDQILSALRTNSVNAKHALQAAAWIGDDAVIAAFNLFDNAFPPWRKNLCIAPSEYARCAGWELDNNARRELTLSQCWSIRPAQQQPPQSGISLFEPTGQTCPWCRTRLVKLLDIAPQSHLFPQPQIHADRIEVISCFQCTCYGTIYGLLDDAGHGHWSSHNTAPKFFVKEVNPNSPSPWSQIPLQLSPRSIFHAADVFLPTTYTQFGGIPAWVQNMDYPTCYACGKTMTFIAQIDNGDFPRNEGVYYVFLCPPCRITATNYQQT